MQLSILVVDLVSIQFGQAKQGSTFIFVPSFRHYLSQGASLPSTASVPLSTMFLPLAFPKITGTSLPHLSHSAFASWLQTVLVFSLLHTCVLLVLFLSVEQPTCHHHSPFRRLGWVTGMYPPQGSALDQKNITQKARRFLMAADDCARTALPSPLTHVFPSGGGVLGSCDSSCLRNEPSPESRYSKQGNRSWVDKSNDLFSSSFMHSGSFLHTLFTECFSSFANTVGSNRCQNIGQVTWRSKLCLSNMWL